MPDTAQADPKAAFAADMAARDEAHHNRVFSFRCRSCGRLEESAHAGEADHPHSCRVCGAGVSFDPRTGVKTLDPANWEVLADGDDARLKELGLARDRVAKHEPAPASGPQREPRNVTVTAADGAKSADGAG